MENAMEDRAEERAVNEIMETLGMNASAADEPATPPKPEREGTGRKAAPKITLEEKNDATPQDRQALALYNAAIDALENLIRNEIFEADTMNHTPACVLLSGLKHRRREYFEKLIDWYLIAGAERR